MLGTSFLLLTLAATGLAQAPGEGYRKVIITSNVNTKFVIVPKEAKAGSTTVMYVVSKSREARRRPLTGSFALHSKTRNDKPEQQWWLKDGASKIQLVGSTLCMDGGAKGEQHPFPDWNRENTRKKGKRRRN